MMMVTILVFMCNSWSLVGRANPHSQVCRSWFVLVFLSLYSIHDIFPIFMVFMIFVIACMASSKFNELDCIGDLGCWCDF